MMTITARTVALLLAAALLFSQNVLSLQVSPNSPCASVCVDMDGTDLSDPNSSNTRSTDITCKDADYARTAKGAKWQKCMTCLEKSTFYQGSESDQGWFLYNLRYNFNYCVFGYPNNTQIGSNPCQTSTACGALKNALLDGNMDPRSSSDYGFCSADGASMTGQFYAKCLSCIHSFTDQVYVSNGLVALEAGCLQKPAPGKIVSVSATVFSAEQITIVDPGTASGAASSSSGGGSGSSTPTTMIAVIAISAVIAAAAIAAVVFVCVRKRRNRRARAAMHNGPLANGGGRHRPKSSLSFRCQTHLSPMSPKFFSSSSPAVADDDVEYSGTAAAMDEPRRHITSSPRSPASSSMPAGWQRASSIGGTFSAPSPVLAEKRLPGEPLSAVSEKHQMFLSEKQQLQQLHALTTAIPPPTAPLPTHTTSTVAAGGTRPSPQSATPTSATQLLPGSGSGRLSISGGGGFAPYVPADYVGAVPPRNMHLHQNPHSPVSPVAPRQPGSPGHMQQQWGWAVSTAAGPAKSPRMSTGAAFGVGSGRKARESGSPVETVAIQTSFPGPPRR